MVVVLRSMEGQKYLINNILIMLWRVRKRSDLLKNILMCVQKLIEGLKCLKQHEVLMTKVSNPKSRAAAVNEFPLR